MKYNFDFFREQIRKIEIKISIILNLFIFSNFLYGCILPSILDLYHIQKLKIQFLTLSSGSKTLLCIIICPYFFASTVCFRRWIKKLKTAQLFLIKFILDVSRFLNFKKILDSRSNHQTMKNNVKSRLQIKGKKHNNTVPEDIKIDLLANFKIFGSSSLHECM